MRPEAVEQLRLARFAELLAHAASGLLQRRQRPAAVELPLRRALIRRFECQAVLSFQRVQGNQLTPTAALERLGVPMRVMQEVIQRGQQEGAKAAPVAVCLRHGLVGQQFGEESLCQVARRFRVMAAPPDVRVEGKPISLAECAQRRLRTGRPGICRRQDDTPMGGCENRRGAGVCHPTTMAALVAKRESFWLVVSQVENAVVDIVSRRTVPWASRNSERTFKI